MNEAVISPSLAKYRAAYEKRIQKQREDQAKLIDQATVVGLPAFLEAFAKAVREDEREACIKVCEDSAEWHKNRLNYLQAQVAATCAASIKTRGAYE